MKSKFFPVLVCMVLLPLVGYSQQANVDHDKKMEWWREARLGMFIHWGPYAVWGGEYHGHRQRKIGAEWIMNACKIPVAEYQQVAATFNPVKFDADKWVRLAKEAGMKYIVFTAKHHDGFAMFKSEASQFNIVDFTPYGKDILADLAKACRKYKIKLGLYYSQAQDWNNPGGAASRRTMDYGWANPDSVKIDAYTLAHGGHWDPVQESRTMEKYIHTVAIPQVREILTGYGEISVLWWDTPTDMTGEFARSLLVEAQKLQPDIITNDRLKRPDFQGDFRTSEQKIPGAGDITRDWEACMTLNGSWGYKSWDHDWKTPETLIRNLIDIASKGGNYLLNIGPDALGEIPQPSIDRLNAVGQWMEVNGEAIYGTQGSPIGKPDWGCCTKKESKKGDILYLSVFDWPANGELFVKGISDVQSASLLAGKTKLKTTRINGDLIIYLPEQAPDPIASVIKVNITKQ